MGEDKKGNISIKKNWNKSVWIPATEEYFKKFEIYKYGKENEPSKLKLPRVYDENLKYFDEECFSKRQLNETKEESEKNIWMTEKELKEKMQEGKTQLLLPDEFIPTYKPSVYVREYKQRKKFHEDIGDSPLEIRKFPQSKRILPKLIRKPRCKRLADAYGKFSIKNSTKFMQGLQNWEKNVREVRKLSKQSLKGLKISKELKFERNYSHKGPSLAEEMEKAVEKILNSVHAGEKKIEINQEEEEKKHKIHHIDVLHPHLSHKDHSDRRKKINPNSILDSEYLGKRLEKEAEKLEKEYYAHMLRLGDLLSN